MSWVLAFNMQQYYYVLSVWPEPQFPHLYDGAAATLSSLEGELRIQSLQDRLRT